VVVLSSVDGFDRLTIDPERSRRIEGRPYTVPMEKIKNRSKKRIHVFYLGRVQGVGFRFTAERVALFLGITGWVKNLPDGRVEVVAEGDEAKLVLFLEKMKNGPMKPYLRGVAVDWQEARGEFQDFSLRF